MVQLNDPIFRHSDTQLFSIITDTNNFLPHKLQEIYFFDCEKVERYFVTREKEMEWVPFHLANNGTNHN